MNASSERLLGYPTGALVGVDVRDSPWKLEDENGTSLETDEWPIVTTLESGAPSGRFCVSPPRGS